MDERPDRESLFEKHRENIYFRWGLTAFVVIVACVVVTLIVFNVSSIIRFLQTLVRVMAPVFYGLGIAYLLDPIVERLQLLLRPPMEKRMKKPGRAEGLSRGLSVLVAMILLMLVIWALLAMVLPQLLDSLNTIIGNMPAYYNTLSKWVSDLIADNIEVADFTGEVMDTVYDYLTNWLSTSLLPRIQTIVVNLTTSAVSIVRALVNLIIGLIISVYLLMGKDKFLAQAKKLSYALLGERRGGYFCNICTFANQAFGGFIGGKIIDSFIIGVLCFIGLSLMKMPYTLLISIIVGVTNIIPFFGPYLGAIPSALLLLVIDPLHALYFIIFIIILQQVDGNIIGPMILSDATGVSGFWVVVSILVFGSFWGVLGMVLAVPLFAVIYKLVTEAANRLLRRRGLSTVTTDYQEWNYPARPEPENWIRKKAPRRHRFSAWLTEKKNSSKTPPPEDQDPPDAFSG